MEIFDEIFSMNVESRFLPAVFFILTPMTWKKYTFSCHNDTSWVPGVKCSSLIYDNGRDLALRYHANRTWGILVKNFSIARAGWLMTGHDPMKKLYSKILLYAEIGLSNSHVTFLKLSDWQSLVKSKIFHKYFFKGSCPDPITRSWFTLKFHVWLHCILFHNRKFM